MHLPLLKCHDHLWARMTLNWIHFFVLSNFNSLVRVHETWKKSNHWVKYEPPIPTACQKETYPESFINLCWPQAKWIHDLSTWPKGGHDLYSKADCQPITVFWNLNWSSHTDKKKRLIILATSLANTNVHLCIPSFIHLFKIAFIL